MLKAQTQELAIQKKFVTAWVTEPGRDYRAILRVAEKIEFLTTGYETSGEQLASAIKQKLEIIDFLADIIVPAGRVLSNWIVAAMIAETKMPFHIAIYTFPGYTIYRHNPGAIWWGAPA